MFYNISTETILNYHNFTSGKKIENLLFLSKKYKY